ncbi:hypothetical protein F5Y04DRAFT_293223 [Hypomontagnella monticulosa]|nr:hypothetical protein F5Y04DRAFT_293223 [Hypomontagnella monticulosa]
MARISLERMPESKSDWLSACKKCGIQDPMTDSIHDRSVLLNSGSQVGNGQFLLLRVLWPRPERPFSNNAPNSDKIVPKKYLLVAREALAKSPWFQACLEWLNLKTPSLGLANPQSRKMGPFFLFFQSHTYTQGLEDVESEKVEFSPISSRIRSKVQPEPESGPRTPSTPTPLRSVRTSGMNVDDIDVDMDMEDEEPSPIPTASPLTGEAAKQASPIKNEQEVVFCLLTLLRAVCASVPEGGRATWKADQIEFTLDDNEGKKIFSAKTDINLECDQKEGNQVIRETKRVHRYAENDGGAGVKAQESCQMVG